MALTPEELMAGGALTHIVEIPEKILYPDSTPKQKGEKEYTVTLRPLTIKDIQLIIKASKDNPYLASSLMLQQALVEPSLKLEQINSMHSGLVGFLIDKINQVSGLSVAEDKLKGLVQAPLVRACFILAKEFGWTPQQVSGMTIGQILLYMEMINECPK
ncbi:MAG: hypothetical protein V1749_07225 [Candidatus Desantisbacteria bacterium]